MEPRDILYVLRKQRRTIVLLAVSAAVTAAVTVIGFTYGGRDKYEATALVLVKPHENIRISSGRDDKELLNFPVGGGTSKVEVPSNTYIEVTRSRAVAEKIVRQLRLDRETSQKSLYSEVSASVARALQIVKQILRFGKIVGDAPLMEQLVERVQNNISLKAIKDTYLFQIQYTASDSRTAAAVANAAAELFLDYMIEINSLEAKRTLAFIEGRLRDSERDLATARQALRQFGERNGSISFKEETTEEVKAISELEMALAKAEVKLAALLKETTSEHPKAVALEAERDWLRAALAHRKSGILGHPEKERQLANLKLDVQVAEEIYQLIKKEYEETRLRTGRDVSEIKVVSPAAVPTVPAVRLWRSLYLAAAIVMALLFGTAWALASEYVDSRITRVVDIEQGLGLRVLATVPKLGPGAAGKEGTSAI